MLNQGQSYTLNFAIPSRVLFFALTLFCGPIFLALQSAQAQTFSVLHAFSGGSDGDQPLAGVTIDQAGNLYGTTTQSDRGTVFEMKRHNGAWVFNTLYAFPSGEWFPEGRIVAGPDGALYGTTYLGGTGGCSQFGYGCGAVYTVRGPRTVCKTANCPWTGTVAYSFTGPDGNNPAYVDPVFDSAGNMYGTTANGGSHTDGNVWELSPSNGTWIATNLHVFQATDGQHPYSGITFDTEGNIYGTTWFGGPSNNGTVYRMTNSGSGWTLQTLYAFPNSSDGAALLGGVVFDATGNLYGTTARGGVNGGGTIFELSPSGRPVRRVQSAGRRGDPSGNPPRASC